MLGLHVVGGAHGAHRVEADGGVAGDVLGRTQVALGLTVHVGHLHIGRLGHQLEDQGRKG